MALRYYQLVAALPAVPYFRRAARLPMSRLRLERRLRMLDDRDRADLGAAESLISWARQPVSRTTGELVALYGGVIHEIRNPALASLVTFRMDMRTVMVALRLRRAGLPVPPEPWGVGAYVRTLTTRWGEPDFGLSHVFPWVSDARAFLARGDAMALEGLLMDQSWRALSKAGESSPFGFESVFATVFKLDILDRWLSYDARAASEHFEQLILEVTRDHQQLFA